MNENDDMVLANEIKNKLVLNKEGGAWFDDLKVGEIKWFNRKEIIAGIYETGKKEGFTVKQNGRSELVLHAKNENGLKAANKIKDSYNHFGVAMESGAATLMMIEIKQDY